MPANLRCGAAALGRAVQDTADPSAPEITWRVLTINGHACTLPGRFTKQDESGVFRAASYAHLARRQESLGVAMLTLALYTEHLLSVVYTIAVYRSTVESAHQRSAGVSSSVRGR